MSSARGANGPTKAATQSQSLGDLARSRAIAPPSGIEAIETITTSHVITPLRPLSPVRDHNTESDTDAGLSKK